MSLFNSILNGLSGSVGQNLDNHPDDIKKTERALKREGYFGGDHSEGFITAELDKGIRNFQRDNNLKTDGVMHPNGETELALLKKVKQAQQETNIPKPVRKPEKQARQEFSGLNINKIPEAKKAYYTIKENNDALIKWQKAIDANPELSEREKDIYTEILIFEGGTAIMDGTTRAGVTQQALKDLEGQDYHTRMVKKYGAALNPKALSEKDIQGFYKAYFDRYLDGAAKGYNKSNANNQNLTGSQLFDLFDNGDVAKATADPIFRHGSTKGVEMVQQAIGITNGTNNIKPDGVFGSQTLQALRDISQDKAKSRIYLDNLYEIRKDYNENGENLEGDNDRNSHFKF